MSRIGGMVKGSISDLGLEQRVLEQQAVVKWRGVVGPQIAASSAPEYVRDGTLFVCCKSSVWSNELSLHKHDIMKRLNSAIGRKVITDIRFSARGFRRASENTPKDEGPTVVKGLDGIPVGEADVETARKTAAASPFADLAERIEKAVLTSKRLAELKRQEGWKTCPKCSCLHKAKQDLCEDCL